MMFSETPIVVHVRFAVGGVDEDPGDRTGAPARVEYPDPVVGEMDAPSAGKCAPMAWRRAESSALIGPLPSAVATTRSSPTWTLTVASVVSPAWWRDPRRRRHRGRPARRGR